VHPEMGDRAVIAVAAAVVCTNSLRVIFLFINVYVLVWVQSSSSGIEIRY
jgi:hypothetical protein